ncbi:hypothetical protein AC622_11420 [Bacillus sp. FJAT-27916]|uniref:hypothetical protein n=1 Tax=Bacillaceae TaxID=186817 RepID=UPI0006717036|nr:hypothetical protein [Bacillus sp. FJAT-27916]KMY44758.1 hypothetical protein AC622_11420 [Bacillus sp. FJAT-27916]
MNDFFWIGLGLAALGYFIGEGLRNFRGSGNPWGDSFDDEEPLMIKKKDLHYYIGIKKEDVDAFIAKYPAIPHIVLNGNTYFPHKKLLEWMESDDLSND